MRDLDLRIVVDNANAESILIRTAYKLMTFVERFDFYSKMQEPLPTIVPCPGQSALHNPDKYRERQSSLRRERTLDTTENPV